MAYHTTPDRALLSLDGLRYTIRHVDRFIRPDDPDIDESHIHNCHEIYVNVSGDVSFLVENRLYPIHSGDAVVTRPGEMHLCVYRKACVHEHFCLWIDAPADSPPLAFLDRPQFCNLWSPDGGARGKTLDLLYRLDGLRGGRDLERTALFLQLLCLLDDRQEPDEKRRAAMPGELQRVLDHINGHFREMQHVREIYDLFYVSPSSLNRWFREYIHLSPRGFLEAKKLACAQQLLMRGLTVSQVCVQCGFSDCSHFISVFKKKFGETPYRYKKNGKPPR